MQLLKKKLESAGGGVLPPYLSIFQLMDVLKEVQYDIYIYVEIRN